MILLFFLYRFNFLKKYKWSITPTDGHVTVHKILEYVNKHTGREVEYKPTLLGALTVIGAILGTLAVGVLIFITFRKFFLNSTVWLVGSIVIYVVCAGGLVHNIIHNIPMTT
jgi:oligosaccharyltransferase complex subunit gamma